MTTTKLANGGQPSPDATLAPHNLEAEAAVLGSILINPIQILTLVNTLKADDFFLMRHVLIYKAMLDLYTNRIPIDNITVADWLRSRNQLEDVGGNPYLYELTNAAPFSSVDAEIYGRLVSRHAIRRKLLQVATTIAQSANDTERDSLTILSDAQRIVMEVASESTRHTITTQSKAVGDWYAEIMRRELLLDNPDVGKYIGIPTGFPTLDDVIGGLQPQKLSIFAALTGHGKSGFMINVIYNIAQTGTPVGVFSLEMSEDDLIDVMVGVDTGLNSQTFNSPEEIVKNQRLIAESKSRLEKLPIYYDDTPGQTAMSIENKARTMIYEYGVKVIFIDHLGIMGAGEENARAGKEKIYGDNSRKLKEIAKDLNIHVWCLAQLNREIYKSANKKPSVAHIRQSHEIEQNADIVCLWVTPCMFDEGDTEARPRAGQPADAYLYLGKNRRGPKLHTSGVRFEYVLSSQKIKEATGPSFTPPTDWANDI